MKRLLSLVFALFVPTAASASVPRDPAEVFNTAKAWLVLIDQGDYQASWKQTSAALQAEQPLAQWTEAVKAMRNKRGAAIMREVTSYKFKRVTRDAPTPEAVVQFRSQFERSLSKEMVTLLLQDGQWRPSEYTLR
jgi:hypothetical protein